MASEVKAQELVHTLEHGKGRWWILILVVFALAALLTTMHLFTNVFGALRKQNSTALFRGLTHAKGMEQAVIARELARGNGFTTKVIKPAGLQMINEGKGQGAFARYLDMEGPTQGRIPDIYHMPLNPWVNSLALSFAHWFNEKSLDHVDAEGRPAYWVMQEGEFLYAPDWVIAAVSVAFFLLGLLVNFFTVRQLFDDRLAIFTTVLLLLCNRFWEFSSTGLPQNMMVFLFALATFGIANALAARDAARAFWPWLLLTAAACALLILAHGIGLWLSIGLAIFTGIAFRPHWIGPVVLAIGIACAVLPWAMRTGQVVGKYTGLGMETRKFQLRGTESQIMRTFEKPDDQIEPTNYTTKLLSQTVAQLEKIYTHLGMIVATPFFFLALLHNFRRRETRSLRWALLLAWLFAFLGMAFFGYSDYELLAGLQSNDIHLLFIPLMTAYGLAMLLNLWSRVTVGGRELARIPVVHKTFIGLVTLLSAVPTTHRYFTPPPYGFEFPPYCPPVLQQVASWYNDNEVICSDMPWGVAWYTDRRSLWLPLTVRDFDDLNSPYNLNGRITGLLLTPVTGFRGLLSDVGVGEYREWAGFIMRNPRAAANFPLAVPKPLFFMRAAHYILYADRDRWTERNN